MIIIMYMDKLQKDIYTYLYEHNFNHVYTITTLDNCVAIHNLLIHNVYSENDKDIVNLYYGIYYQLNKDYDNMIKHYLVSINLNNLYAMMLLKNYYELINDYDNIIKYNLLYNDNIYNLYRYAYNNNKIKVLSHLYDNFLQNILKGYKNNYIYFVSQFLITNKINSDLLLLIANINLNHFCNYNKLILTIHNLLNNKIMLMNSQFKYIQI